jgi:brefeldin A-inhibited guanine nucleotide-exchange protein
MDKDMLDDKYWEVSIFKNTIEGRKGELADADSEKDVDVEFQISNKLR